MAITLEELKAKFGVVGPEDGVITRKLLREWLTDTVGLPYEHVAKMTYSTMVKCYQIPKYLAAVSRAHLRADSKANPDGTRTVSPSPQGQDVAALARSFLDFKKSVVEMVDTQNERVLQLNDDYLIAMLKKHFKPEPITIQIKVNDQKPTKLEGRQHKQFPSLLKAASARRANNGQRLNIMLVGPAGSGKTTAAEQIAKALKLPFYFNGAIDTEYKLLGFTDAHGKTVRRPFREAFSKPSVYLFDEIDGSHPNGCLPLNAALSNGAVDFPDAIEKRHKDAIIIAAANTFGNGATPDYVGRNKLDAAFLDRFAIMRWDIDEELERATCNNHKWAERVQEVRARVQAKGIKMIISPRATYDGEALLEAGLEMQEVEQMVLRKGMSNEQWAMVQ